MITPPPRSDGSRQRFVAAAGSALLMVGLYTGLRGTPLPAFGSSSAVIRELDPLFLERYTAPPPPARDETEVDPEPEAPAAVDLDADVGSAIDELVRRFESGGSATALGASAGRARPTAPDPAIGTEPDDRFTNLFGGSVEEVSVGPRSRRPVARESLRGGGGIALGTRQPRVDEGTLQSGSSDPGSSDIAVEARTERNSDAETSDVVINEYEAETFDRFDADVLTGWMEAHAAELPVGVRVHLNYVPTFLTAAVPFESGGRDLELFLMYNTGLRELHIMLVEGERSVYLIDRGFQAQSRSLREGTVRRLNGEIVTVDSRAGAASSDRAREFYNTFLSWWEVARHDVGR